MQTILGSNGIIGSLLAKELASNWTTDLKLVSRNPQKVNKGDVLFSADLLDLEQTTKALDCLLYTSPSPRDATLSRMPSSA